ncbi:hypothetical protein GCM10020331_000610 [Ectobacillus funiculus]
MVDAIPSRRVSHDSIRFGCKDPACMGFSGFIYGLYGYHKLDCYCITIKKIAFAALHDYMKQKKSWQGSCFYKDSIKGLENIECWEHSQDASTSKKDRHHVIKRYSDCNMSEYLFGSGAKKLQDNAINFKSWTY